MSSTYLAPQGCALLFAAAFGCKLVPVTLNSVDVMSLYGMADFKPRGAVRNLTITISSRIAFHLIHNVGTPVYLISGLNCLMTLPPDFLRLIYGVTVGISKVATGDVVSIFPDGISTR